MTKPTSPPTSVRGKIVYFIWNNMPRFVLLGLIVIIMMLVVAIKESSETIAANKAAETTAEKPPVNTITMTMTPRPIHDKINLPGVIEPWTRLQLLAKIGGTVTEVLVSEGDKVKKGDPLAKIEEADYRINVERTDAAYKLAKAEYERDQSVYSKGVIPTATLDAKRTAMQTALADFDNAKLQLSRTVITAPMNGTISRLEAKVGLQLSIGDPVAEILEVDRMKGVIGIPESDVTAVQQLDTVELTIQALDELKVIGRKHFLSPSPGTIARLYDLELEIPNPDGAMLSGMFIRADIVKKTVADALAVPLYSVINRNDEQYVFVEEDGVVHKRPVQLGIMEKWLVQITDGVKADEKVLVEGHRDVEDGQLVKVIQNINSTEGLLR